MPRLANLARQLFNKLKPRDQVQLVRAVIGVFALIALFNVITFVGINNFLNNQEPSESSRLASLGAINTQSPLWGERFLTFTSLNERLTKIPNTIEVPKWGYNAGQLVSGILGDSYYWERLQKDGTGYVLAIALNEQPSGPVDAMKDTAAAIESSAKAEDAAIKANAAPATNSASSLNGVNIAEAKKAAEYIQRANSLELMPILRFCYGDGAKDGACGIRASVSNRLSWTVAGQRLGRYCVYTFRLANGTSFYCAIGPNEPATEAPHWIKGFDPKSPRSWEALSTIMRVAYDFVRSYDDPATPMPGDNLPTGFDYKKIKLSPGILNITNRQNNEINLLFTPSGYPGVIYNEKAKDPQNRCRHWDAFMGNTYNIYNSGDPLVEQLRMSYPYLNNQGGPSLAALAKKCGTRVIFTEIGYISSQTQDNLCLSGKYGDASAAYTGGGAFRLGRLIEPLRIEMEALAARPEVEAMLFFRPLGAMDKRYFSGQKVENNTASVSCLHTLSDPEIQYITAPLGGDSDKNNDYRACVYPYKYEERSIVRTSNLRNVGANSTGVRLSLNCPCPGGKCSSSQINCNSSGYTVLEVETPTKAMTANHYARTTRNQYFSVCAQAAYNNLAAAKVAGVDAEYVEKLINYFEQVPVQAKVAGIDYPIPGIESMRNCSEMLKNLISFDFNKLQGGDLAAAFRDTTTPLLSPGADAMITFDIESGLATTGEFGKVQTDLYGIVPKNQSTSYFIRQTDDGRGVNVNLAARDTIARQLAQTDNSIKFDINTAVKVKVGGDTTGVKVGVQNPDLMQPGPQKKFGNDIKQNWNGGNVICWDNKVHWDFPGWSRDTLVQKIYGDYLGTPTPCRFKGAWDGYPDSILDKARIEPCVNCGNQCPFINYEEMKRLYKTDGETFNWRLAYGAKGGFDPKACFEFVGNPMKYRLEAEFKTNSISNGIVEIPGLLDTAANLTKYAEYLLAKRSTLGKERSILMDNTKGLPIFTYVKTMDANRPAESVTSPGESFYYESNSCKLPGGANMYRDNDHRIAWGAGGVQQKVVYSNVLYNIDAALRVITELFNESEPNFDNAINYPSLTKIPVAVARQEVGNFRFRNVALNTNLERARCADINAPMINGYLLKGGAAANVFSYFDCVIGWNMRGPTGGIIRMDKNPWHRYLCDKSLGTYGDGEYLDCGGQCSIAAATASPNPTPTTPAPTTPAPTTPTPAPNTTFTGGVCPVPNAFCYQGPYRGSDDSQAIDPSASHGQVAAVDISADTENPHSSQVVVAPVAGKVVWAANGQQYTRCLNGSKAGGAFIFKPDHGGKNLFFYHVRIDDTNAILRNYAQGEQIAALSKEGDLDVDNPGCWGRDKRIVHAHIELAGGERPSSIVAEAPNDLLALYGCSFVEDRQHPKCGADPEKARASLAQVTPTTTQPTVPATPAPNVSPAPTATTSSGVPAYCKDLKNADLCVLPDGSDTEFSGDLYYPVRESDNPVQTRGYFLIGSQQACGNAEDSFCLNGGHRAIDIGNEGNKTNVPVFAAAGGQVISVTNDAAYGNVVVIDHGGERFTRYAHLASVVPNLSTVAAGDQIGVMGTTGNSTGIHLHFEYLVNCQTVTVCGTRPRFVAGPPPGGYRLAAAGGGNVNISGTGLRVREVTGNRASNKFLIASVNMSDFTPTTRFSTNFGLSSFSTLSADLDVAINTNFFSSQGPIGILASPSGSFFGNALGVSGQADLAVIFPKSGQMSQLVAQVNDLIVDNNQFFVAIRLSGLSTERYNQIAPLIEHAFSGLVWVEGGAIRGSSNQPVFTNEVVPRSLFGWRGSGDSVEISFILAQDILGSGSQHSNYADACRAAGAEYCVGLDGGTSSHIYLSSGFTNTLGFRGVSSDKKWINPAATNKNVLSIFGGKVAKVDTDPGDGGDDDFDYSGPAYCASPTVPGDDGSGGGTPNQPGTVPKQCSTDADKQAVRDLYKCSGPAAGGQNLGSTMDLVRRVANITCVDPSLMATILSVEHYGLNQTPNFCVSDRYSGNTNDYNDVVNNYCAMGPAQFTTGTQSGSMYLLPSGSGYAETLACVQQLGLNIKEGDPLCPANLGVSLCAMGVKLNRDGKENLLPPGVTFTGVTTVNSCTDWSPELREKVTGRYFGTCRNLTNGMNGEGYCGITSGLGNQGNRASGGYNKYKAGQCG